MRVAMSSQSVCGTVKLKYTLGLPVETGCPKTHVIAFGMDRKMTKSIS